jgi:DNA-binding GntR family transcriptional regulator
MPRNGEFGVETVTPQRLRIEPLEISISLRKQACEAIRRAITDMDLYGQSEDIWLDERQLSQELGVSRTPIREALSVLEQEGFVRSVPRRGVVVVRKSKQEVIAMITVWAAIESMAARLAAPRVTEADVASLRALVDAFDDDPSAHLTEYSKANMEFHKTIIRLGGVALMTTLTETLFIHMRAVRAVTMTQENRAQRSVADHRAIIAALAAHDPELAERLVREHTMGLAAHVEKYADFPDGTAERARPSGASVVPVEVVPAKVGGPKSTPLAWQEERVDAKPGPRQHVGGSRGALRSSR